MNRRSFFNSLALIGAAVSASPHIFIPKFESVTWKRSFTPAPFLEEFKYEIQRSDTYGLWDVMLLRRTPGNAVVSKVDFTVGEEWLKQRGLVVNDGIFQYRPIEVIHSNNPESLSLWITLES